MEIRVKTKEGQIIFTDIDPGCNIDALIPREGSKGIKVWISTTPFREIKSYSSFESVTTFVNQPEDDMVRVVCHIDYRDHKSYVTLVTQEVPIKTKKVKFRDKTGYVIVTEED